MSASLQALLAAADILEGETTDDEQGEPPQREEGRVAVDMGEWRDATLGVPRGTALEVEAFCSIHDMLHAAILHRGGRATLPEIYHLCHVKGRLAYRRKGGSRRIALNVHWKSQIRHALYTNNRFCRCQDSSDQWTVSRSHAHMVPEVTTVRIIVGQETGGGRGPSGKGRSAASSGHAESDDDDDGIELPPRQLQGARGVGGSMSLRPARTSSRAAARATGELFRRIGADEGVVTTSVRRLPNTGPAAAVGARSRTALGPAAAAAAAAFPAPPPMPPFARPPPMSDFGGMNEEPWSEPSRSLGPTSTSYYANPEPPKPRVKKARSTANRRARPDCSSIVQSLAVPAPTRIPLASGAAVGSDETAVTAVVGISESTGLSGMRHELASAAWGGRGPVTRAAAGGSIPVPPSPLEGANYAASWAPHTNTKPPLGPWQHSQPSFMGPNTRGPRSLNPLLAAELDGVEEGTAQRITGPLDGPSAFAASPASGIKDAAPSAAGMGMASLHPRLKRKAAQQASGQPSALFIAPPTAGPVAPFPDPGQIAAAATAAAQAALQEALRAEQGPIKKKYKAAVKAAAAARALEAAPPPTAAPSFPLPIPLTAPAESHGEGGWTAYKPAQEGGPSDVEVEQGRRYNTRWSRATQEADPQPGVPLPPTFLSSAADADTSLVLECSTIGDGASLSLANLGRAASIMPPPATLRKQSGGGAGALRPSAA